MTGEKCISFASPERAYKGISQRITDRTGRQYNKSNFKVQAHLGMFRAQQVRLSRLARRRWSHVFYCNLCVGTKIHKQLCAWRKLAAERACGEGGRKASTRQNFWSMIYGIMMAVGETQIFILYAIIKLELLWLYRAFGSNRRSRSAVEVFGLDSMLLLAEHNTCSDLYNITNRNKGYGWAQNI